MTAALPAGMDDTTRIGNLISTWWGLQGTTPDGKPYLTTRRARTQQQAAQHARVGFTVVWADQPAAFYGGKCYACDDDACGLATRWADDGTYEVVNACDRHRDRTARTFKACIYCSTAVRKGSLIVDGNFAHKACHEDASR